MTDKSFGDHMSRNIVKNPLLSTAVTGLSFEDLTHNAVLLPVPLSQEVISQPDQQFATQNRTLGHSEHVTPNFPSGDANSNTIYSNPPSNNNPTPLDYEQNKKIEKSYEKPCLPQSKASAKTDDDFDVNEYFARLQGTRYVSAPLNQNVNLDATEENLEEINLNDPDKGPTDIPQSITADIAQNFSQLPQVLPQVASAVFSSFSNMLSMKSREQTPDDVKPGLGHQGARNEATTVALMGVSDVEVKEVAPPPKELNVVGTGNYRLATKKKYAPIPGLSSGEQTSNQMYFAPNHTVETKDVHRDSQPYNMQPSYFVPSVNSQNDGTYNPNVETSVHRDTKPFNVQQSYLATSDGTQTNTQSFNQPTYFVPSVEAHTKDSTDSVKPNQRQDQAIDMFNTASNIPETSNSQNRFAGKETVDFFIPKQNIKGSIQDITVPQPAPIIPPPPMFSNIQRREDSQSVGKSVLPPSVARRIAANQPVIKPQATITSLPENIFVPAPMFAESTPDQIETDSQSMPPAIKPPSAFAQFSVSASPVSQSFMTNVPGSMTSMSSQSSNVSVPMFSSTASVLPPPPTNVAQFSSSQPVKLPASGPSFPAPMSTSFGSFVPPTAISASQLIANVPKTGPASISPMNMPTQIASIPSSVLPPLPMNLTPNLPMTGSASTTPINMPKQIASSTPVPTFSSSGSSFLPPPPSNVTPNIPTTGSTFSTPGQGSLPMDKQTQITSVPVFTGQLPTTALNFQSQVPGSQDLPFASLPQPNLPPPPTFFNPSAITKQLDPQMSQSVPPNVSQFFDQTQPQSEPSKPIPEPPKATGMNYRMTKKRPQYYSGPIEGVGAISNNVKPVIAPVETTSFHGALFTPASDVPVVENVAAPNLEQSTVPFDISKPVVAAPEQRYEQPEYNTAFDFSRGTTESYDAPKQEPKGFGIIGSLKSKLSALDINKIQDSVTTFFDPAYKEVKKESADNQETVPYSQQTDYGQNTYNQFTDGYQNQSSNFEIFVPNVEQQYQPYNYQMPYQDPSYQNQTLQNYYENKGQTIPTSSYYSNPSLNVSTQVYVARTNTSATVSYSTNLSTFPQEIPKNIPDNSNVMKRTDNDEEVPDCAIPSQYLNAQYNAEEKLFAETKHIEAAQDLTENTKPELDLQARSFFDISQSEISKSEELKSNKNLQLSEDNPKNEECTVEQTEAKIFDIQSLLSKGNPSDFFDSPIGQQEDMKTQHKVFSNYVFAQDNEATRSSDTVPEERDIEDLSKTDFDVSAPLFGLSTMLADKTKELTDLEYSSHESPKDIDTIFNRNSNQNFFEMESENKPLLDDNQEDVPDLNICETCREVNKPEDRDIDDLTAQLIENITSPIQLSNPVEVPLTESKTLVDDGNEFDSNQFDEISHITEETIETIQVQSATELLDKDMTSRSYGWTDDAVFPTKVSDEILTNPNPIGFLIPFDIPNNASDEIKAEFKITQEEPVPVIPVAPSAPPEEDTKSDETGIDVHSIEQDATKDFPFEEYVIEPSETDDDKIEREKSLDDIQDIDSFTNRVERYKKMEDTDVLEKTSPTFDLTAATSPYLPMPSYFDTGNYAADTHYRNSLTSPNLASIGLDLQMRVPPGFEEEYERRLGLKEHVLEENKNENIPYIPDTSTQTRPTFSPTFSTAKPNIINITTVASSTPFTDSKLPEYSIFGVNKGDIKSPSTFENPKPIELLDTQKVFNLFGDKKEEISPDFLRKIPPVAPPVAEPKISKAKVITETENLLASVIGLTLDDDIKPPLNVFDADVTEEEIKPSIKLFDQAIISLKEEILFRPETTNFEPQKLEDPLNFFSTTAEDTNAGCTTDAGDNSFNRLASYFSSPPKSDSSKSFFELSQGQNHYRRNPADTKGPQDDDRKQKSFFELSQSQNHYIDDKNIQNIPQDKLLANLNLMNDLTSYQNAEFKPEQSVKTVNYFTVEYDNENLNLNIDCNKGDAKKETDKSEDVASEMPETKNHDDKTVKTIVRKCKFCCNLNYGCVLNINKIDHESIVTKEFKVKNCMNNNTEDKKQTDGNMNKEQGADRKYSVDVDFPNLVHDETDDGVAMMSEIQGQLRVTKMKKRYFVGYISPIYDITILEIEHNEIFIDMKSVPSSTSTVQIGTEHTTAPTSLSVRKQNRSATEYTPVQHHWFYRVDIDGKSTWRGFSVKDSKALEEAFHNPALNDSTLVATDGGRFDVNVIGRLRVAVYWDDKPSNVRRCSWFYKGTTDARYVPYTEAVAEKLEEEYRHGVTTGEWHRRLVLPNSELVVMHGPAVMVHFLQSAASDAFSSPAPSLFAFGKRVYRNPPKIRVSRDQPDRIDHLIFLVHGAGENKHQREKFQSTMRPRVVRRGHDESEIEDVEPSSIDHLLLLCHGVGSACDMRFRAVEEVVDDFRATSLQLIQSHYRNSFDSGTVGRVEVLPISWHATLHSGETGVDKRLARITLDSIPRLRSFTNDTVLDVLFYTSPVFCQTILDTVCNEMNRIYKLFCQRNPDFDGGVSLGGHSLGSVILYDLLCHQQPPPVPSPHNTDKQYVRGAAGTGQPSVRYPSLVFNPVALYALGSPIAIFECIRGVDALGGEFCMPTCNNFFNIFHPYDPIAYRIEPLINPALRNLKPHLIPHHKGRKRMHLELKDTMARVGADIKQKVIESIKSTWTNMWKSQPPPSDRQLEKVVEEEIEREGLEKETLSDDIKESEACQSDLATPEMLGKLNSGRRVDYVLQEAPFEMINEYLFAMSSHVCYWESEDVMLLMLREIYDSLGVQPDSTVPQQSLTVQRTKIQTDKDNIIVNAEFPSTSRSGT